MKDLLTIPLFVAGGAFGIMTVVQWIALRRFRTFGACTAATVTGVSVQRVQAGKREINVHQLELSYQVGGKTYQAVLAVPFEKTKDAVGATVDVLYNPKEPEKCMSADVQSNNKNVLALLLLTVFFLCAGAALASVG